MTDVIETILLEEGEVIITNRRAVIGTASYALSDIISVRMTKDSSTIGCFVAALLGGGFLLGLFSFVSTQYSSEICSSAFIVGGAAIIIALLVPPNYILQIRSMSGRVYTLKSIDVDYLRRIVDAIDGAMAHGRSFEKRSLINQGTNN